MDESVKLKIRNYGAASVVLVFLLFIILFIVQYKEKAVIAAKLHIVNNEIVQSLTLSLNENGPFIDWGLKKGYKNMDTLQSNFFRYFKVRKYCISFQDKCMPNIAYKSIKKKNTNVNLYKMPSVRLKNGASIAVETVSNCSKNKENCLLLYIDLNGPDEPNAFGKDLFVFSVINSSDNFLVPYGSGLSNDKLKNDLTYGCNKNSKMALYCAALIKANGWSMGISYPW